MYAGSVTVAVILTISLMNSLDAVRTFRILPCLPALPGYVVRIHTDSSTPGIPLLNTQIPFSVSLTTSASL